MTGADAQRAASTRADVAFSSARMHATASAAMRNADAVHGRGARSWTQDMRLGAPGGC